MTARVPEDAPTVAAADIARIAGVGRAAVSNWRRRFPDFPEPVAGSAASPLFPLAEVESWFARHNRPFPVSPADRVWQWIRGTVDELRTGELVGWLGAFLGFLGREPRRWRELSDKPDHLLTVALSEVVAETVPEIPGPPQRLDPEWLPITRVVADLGEDWTPAELFDFLFERFAEVRSRRLPSTPPPVADLMVLLASGSKGTVMDPACGTGTLLLAAASAGATAVYGQDANPEAVRLAASRLLLQGAPVTVRLGNSLRDDALADVQADAVVCAPPFGERSWGYEELAGDPRWEYGLPPRREPELAWAQHCLAHVRLGGPVAVLMPTGAAARRSGRRIRANLLRSGALRAVVRLPGAVWGGDLWLLRRPAPADPPPSHLLVVDCGDDLAMAGPAWASFVADPERELSGPCRTLPIIDLLDDEVDVSPPRHSVGRSYSQAPIRFPALLALLRPMFEGLADLLPDLEATGETAPPPMTTVGELAKAGLLVVHQAPLRMDTDQGDILVLTAKDVRCGRSPSGRTTEQPGLVPVRPGDVVVPLVPGSPVVRVISDETAVVGPQVLLLRTDPQRLDPHFLAGFLRLAGMSVQSRATTFSRLDAGRSPVPLLPLTVQRGYGDAFQSLAAFESEVEEATHIAVELIRLGLTGLAEGTLRPRRDDE